MQKHYILSLDPTAKYDWERCTLRDPITANRPELAALIADAIGHESGSYLVSVNIEVQILETAPTPQTKRVAFNELEASSRPPRTPIGELVA